MKLSKIATFSSLLIISSAAMAAPSTKSISLSWQGTVPISPISGGDWEFVDLMTGSPYVPVIGMLTISSDPGSNKKLLTAAPISFGIKANSSTFKASSDVSAYLAVQPTFTGLVATNVQNNATDLDIIVNGKKLKVGSAGAETVAKIGAKPDAVVGINVSGSGELQNGSYTEGNNVTVTAVIMMTADIT